MGVKKSAAVIGAGAWGTAIAWSLAKNGVSTTLWAFEKEVVEAINSSRENSVYLDGVMLPKNLRATSDMAEAVKECGLVIVVAPSQFMRGILIQLAKVIPEDAVIVSAAKGIENKTLAMPVEMIEETMPQNISRRLCCLSGPTFARELVKEVPTAATIASKDSAAAKLAQQILSAPYFRLYAHDDVIGVEIGGAVKNVLAIAAGIADGIGLGHNTRAAVITRGLAEMIRLGEAMGADFKTFAGLSGIGDLVLTCGGDLSRNRTVGLRLGKGEKIEDILNSMIAVAEGVATSLSVYKLAEKHGVDMPITSEVYKVVHENKDPHEAVKDLMARSLKEEF
ncbi:Glycerol-3-phosphate dehydrogenase [NAD(P)+] [hydrothermal vent metagenome]|uniref:Glycerol-3-phosphate dehydrogenase [NAD(P)+] n=1 Tax=hydrothermal vent metagenome TaxID=652676 RepID=A0A3B1BU14_9ZZZZ